MAFHVILEVPRTPIGGPTDEVAGLIGRKPIVTGRYILVQRVDGISLCKRPGGHNGAIARRIILVGFARTGGGDGGELPFTIIVEVPLSIGTLPRDALTSSVVSVT